MQALVAPLPRVSHFGNEVYTNGLQRSQGQTYLWHILILNI
jgi:hypothetical protein